MCLQEQSRILRRFRTGQLNLLISTAGRMHTLLPAVTLPYGRVASQVSQSVKTPLSLLAVAEEGIDVRSCQLVVRFDLPGTAQVRGCATCPLSTMLSPSLN